MKVLLYNELRGMEIPGFEKLKAHLEAGDLKSADIKKVAENLYRARLDIKARLLLTFRHDELKNCYALILEYLPNHNYEKSRFLHRGAMIDESKIEPVHEIQALPETFTRNLSQQGETFHFLDKIIAFDEAQNNIFCLQAPMIIIGSAGSGKTSLGLEKMKEAQGNVLYVTKSAFLVDHSKTLYYSEGYKNEAQSVTFRSYKEFLESTKVPSGKEMNFEIFNAWFCNDSQKLPALESHKCYEEFSGVLTGTVTSKPYLDEAEYLALGVKQSIYPVQERKAIYEVFNRYLVFLRMKGYFDLNLASFEAIKHSKPKFDFLVVDEVQDMTNIQISLLLSSLKSSDAFLLCGDSNQIVHPNFFSWSKVKSHFYANRPVRSEASEIIQILANNYRNSSKVTSLANSILRLKNARFGAIDRESNYLVRSTSSVLGEVHLVADNDSMIAQINEKTGASTQFAVIVLYEEHKKLAKKRFRTPLVFSIHEAKGLEYKNILLYNFVSSEESIYKELCSGVEKGEIHEGELPYSRPADKGDKSLEIYKFFINAFYVAITRTIQTLIIIEKNQAQRLYELLDIKDLGARIEIEEQKSSKEEWRQEADRLERQGKKEQAEGIRTQMLGVKNVPWEVLTRDKADEVLEASLKSRDKSDLYLAFEYANVYKIKDFLDLLQQEGFKPAQHLEKSQTAINDKYFSAYKFKNPVAVLNEIAQYGPDFRNKFNETPLMVAARFGNLEIAKALVHNKASLTDMNNCGLNAHQMCLLEALIKTKGSEWPADSKFAEFVELLSPITMDIQVGDQLAKLEKTKMEYELFNLFMALFYSHPSEEFLEGEDGEKIPSHGVGIHELAAIIEKLSDPLELNPRSNKVYLRSFLEHHEISSCFASSLSLFKEIRPSEYILSPTLRLRDQGEWKPIYSVLRPSEFKSVQKMTKSASK